MREKGQNEVAKTLKTPVFSRGIEILTEKPKFSLLLSVVYPILSHLRGRAEKMHGTPGSVHEWYHFFYSGIIISVTKTPGSFFRLIKPPYFSTIRLILFSPCPWLPRFVVIYSSSSLRTTSFVEFST